MAIVFALSHQSGVKLAEVAFLLILIAGIWLVVAEIQPAKFHTFRLLVVGGALTAAGVLLIVATHWGHFG